MRALIERCQYLAALLCQGGSGQAAIGVASDATAARAVRPRHPRAGAAPRSISAAWTPANAMLFAIPGLWSCVSP